MVQQLNIGIAGLGTVGVSLVRILQKNSGLLELRTGQRLNIVAVCAQNKEKDRGLDVRGYEWFDDPSKLACSEKIDVFVELIGGDSGPAENSIRIALGAGKHVVTANKALLAKHGMSLSRQAEKSGVCLNYEAAVAGGIPIIKTLRESLAGNTVSRIYGILNGTCNYILTRMEQDHLSFEECLAEAQRLGYAEADPTFDIEGFDAAHKLALMASLAFGSEINAESISVEGITSITTADIEAARELGYRIKLLGVAQQTETGIEQRVQPTMVPMEASIANISGVLNAVAVNGDFVDEMVLVGPGAGGDATATSVVSDITDIARGNSAPTYSIPTESLKPYEQAKMRLHEGGYFIRLNVHDRPGVFASIASAMASHSISLKSIFQHQRKTTERANENEQDERTQLVILITHGITEKAVKDALAEIENDNLTTDKPQMIQIENTY